METSSLTTWGKFYRKVSYSKLERDKTWHVVNNLISYFNYFFTMSAPVDVPSDEEDELQIQHFHEMGLDDRILKVNIWSKCLNFVIGYVFCCHNFHYFKILL